ncbi:3501_t:CDS:2 [Entrophospora sp. SA101]|nr:3501_t:CDS:2 [Entrophospora sp. SA101]
MPPEKRTKGSDNEEKLRKERVLTFLEKKERRINGHLLIPQM